MYIYDTVYEVYLQYSSGVRLTKIYDKNIIYCTIILLRRRTVERRKYIYACIHTNTGKCTYIIHGDNIRRILRFTDVTVRGGDDDDDERSRWEYMCIVGERGTPPPQQRVI